jgi:glycosyltransferase involved in cell wall biosynthesis
MESTIKETSSAPLVSFVVPCYKYAHLLRACVDSILVQNYDNFEVLIMDNCSPDNTPEVAQSFQDARVRHIRNDSNLGAEENFNKGLTLTRGKYIWVLSADDLLRSPSVLRRFVAVMEQNVELGFVFCRAIELEGEKERGVIWWADCGDQDCTWNDSTFGLRLIEFNCIAFSCVLMRRECLNRVGLFPIDLPFAADWYLWIMLALYYGVSYLAEPMVFSRVHKDSLTTQQSREYARICLGDELGVLWRVGHEAKLAQLANLRDACRSALIHRAKRCLMEGVSEAEFAEILQSRIPDMETSKDLRALAYRDLAEQQYSKGEYVAATQSYRLALRARPFHPGTLAKYLFMRTGRIGIRTRRWAHQVRKL